MELLNNILSKGKTQFHVVNEAMNYLTKNGFETLAMERDWKLTSGGKYMVAPYSSMLVAFVIGKEDGNLRMAASHTDFPMLK
ncbi:MAG: M18 family aminopeptidase, partial [Lachnospiraceae bacterium]|nr:M18 family aminopeptidase [Lachnospiraceae bacterium]